MGTGAKLSPQTEGRKFETVQIYRFRDGEAKINVAYQIDNNGYSRLCLVDDEGGQIAAGHSACYQHPCFATFGTYRFMALTEYFEGEVIGAQVVYRLEQGIFVGTSGDDIEGDVDDPSEEDDPEPESDPEQTADDHPWKGWYIHECTAEAYGYGDDQVRVKAHLHCTNGASRETEEILDPPFEKINSVKLEVDGGEGQDQQSIVIIVEGPDGDATDIQIEIDHKTGKFKDDSLRGWEETD